MNIEEQERARYTILGNYRSSKTRHAKLIHDVVCRVDEIFSGRFRSSEKGMWIPTEVRESRYVCDVVIWCTEKEMFDHNFPNWGGDRN